MPRNKICGAQTESVQLTLLFNEHKIQLLILFNKEGNRSRTPAEGRWPHRMWFAPPLACKILFAYCWTVANA